MIEKYCSELKNGTLLILNGDTLVGGVLGRGGGFTVCEAEVIGKAMCLNHSLEKVTLRGIENNGVLAVRAMVRGIMKCRVKQVSVHYNFLDADKCECLISGIWSPYIRNLEVSLECCGNSAGVT